MANILLVEDDLLISRMLSLRLQLRGHTVTLAEDGEAGVGWHWIYRMISS